LKTCPVCVAWSLREASGSLWSLCRPTLRVWLRNAPAMRFTCVDSDSEPGEITSLSVAVSCLFRTATSKRHTITKSVTKSRTASAITSLQSRHRRLHRPLRLHRSLGCRCVVHASSSDEASATDASLALPGSQRARGIFCVCVYVSVVFHRFSLDRKILAKK